MVQCFTNGCTNNNYKSNELNFHKFPNSQLDEIRHKAWVRICCRKDKFNIRYAPLCSKHFRDKQFELHSKHNLRFTKFTRLYNSAVSDQNRPSDSIINSNQRTVSKT